MREEMHMKIKTELLIEKTENQTSEKGYEYTKITCKDNDGHLLFLSQKGHEPIQLGLRNANLSLSYDKESKSLKIQLLYLF